MRCKLVAGNWKMHGSLGQATTLLNGVKDSVKDFVDVEIVVIPPFPYLLHVRSILQNTNLKLGAQNLYLGVQGAYTGEVSGEMLKDVGCKHVLVGHSERRTIFGETSQLIAQKFKSALAADLIPILCVGETKEERDQGKTEAIIKEQITAVVDEVGIDGFNKAIIAYEPVWAIGTGVHASPEQAEAVHIFIRELIAQNNVDLAKTICILYGGSVKPDNAGELFCMPNIDGGLIGGASLDAMSFSKIVAAACHHTTMAKTAERH